MGGDLREILPQERTVEAGGETFTLRPFGFRHMLKALPHFAALMDLVKADEVDGQLRINVNLDRVLMEGSDHLVPLMAMATGRDQDWVDRLDFDDGCSVAAAVLELNADFFARARTRGAWASAPQAGRQPGQTSPPI